MEGPWDFAASGEGGDGPALSRRGTAVESGDWEAPDRFGVWKSDLAEATIGKVAYAVGFNSQSYVSRTFCEEFGPFPSAYRKNGITA